MSTAFPDEVVTEAKVRIIDLPYGAGRCALITIDNGKDHTRPSTFGPGGLASLDAALDQVSQTEGLSAIAFTGKPFIFAVGADLSAVGEVDDPQIITNFAQMGHRVFGRINDLGLPSFAFINGAAMGGGLELALNCDYRTISSSAAAVSLPEVFLGLVPGWGGAWIVPNLIGPERAIEIIIDNPMNQNRQLKPKQVLSLGLADAMFDGADFLTESIRWAANVVRGDVVVSRPEVDRSQWQDIVNSARARVDARIHGATPAPYVALDLIAAAETNDRSQGFAAEDQALTTLVMGDDLRAGLYSFDLVQKRAKRPVGVPDSSLAQPVTKVGIVGAGLMASQLALLFAKRLEVPIVMTDLDEDRVAKGLAYITGDIDGQVAKGRMSSDKANRLKALITGSTSKDGFADADFVLEAVFENLDVKKQVFAEVEEVVSPTCILATNTSSLSVTAMAADLQHPQRVVGFHFFNPVAVMPLLEIARAEYTNDATLATAFAVGKALKKSCVLVKDAPAFVVNRLLTRFLGEVTRAVDEGTDFMVADRALEPLGLPMSPFNLLALVGPAVAFHVSETMNEAFPDRFYVSENMGKLVKAGKSAIFIWDEHGQPSVDPEILSLYTQGNQPSTADEVRARAVDALADEVQRMLDEGVVSDVQDIDLCMLLGAGWPFALGGLSPYLDRSGAAERVTGQRFLPPGVASVA
jgi:3-hydroxyacyl-CoA dehydrogenase/enoyl-CoA hydratase/carnithine racemase